MCTCVWVSSSVYIHKTYICMKNTRKTHKKHTHAHTHIHTHWHPNQPIHTHTHAHTQHTHTHAHIYMYIRVFLTFIPEFALEIVGQDLECIPQNFEPLLRGFLLVCSHLKRFVRVALQRTSLSKRKKEKVTHKPLGSNRRTRRRRTRRRREQRTATRTPITVHKGYASP